LEILTNSNSALTRILQVAGTLAFGTVAPSVLPGAALAKVLEFSVGLGAGITANYVQRKVDSRGNHPSAPDRNHDLVRVVSAAVAYEFAEFGRQNKHRLSRADLKALDAAARKAPESFIEILEHTPPLDLVPPDVLHLLELATRNKTIPSTGQVEEWRKAVDLLTADAGAPLEPSTAVELAQRLQESLWESVRKSLKRDFAADGKGYAALHLDFMGEVLNRLDVLSQKTETEAASIDLNRELLDELRRFKQEQADPTFSRISKQVPSTMKRRLAELTNQYGQISGKLDRRFKEVLDAVNSAEQASIKRDQKSHKMIAGVAVTVSLACVLITVGVIWLNQQNEKRIAPVPLRELAFHIQRKNAVESDSIPIVANGSVRQAVPIAPLRPGDHFALTGNFKSTTPWALYWIDSAGRVFHQGEGESFLPAWPATGSRPVNRDARPPHRDLRRTGPGRPMVQSLDRNASGGSTARSDAPFSRRVNVSVSAIRRSAYNPPRRRAVRDLFPPRHLSRRTLARHLPKPVGSLVPTDPAHAPLGRRYFHR